MKFLIQINTDSELISYEAIALAFTLATFDHEVQLSFGQASQAILSDKSSRLYGMIQSLDLYDLPKAWAQDGLMVATLDESVQAAFDVSGQQAHAQFDTTLTF